jgi:hypothetical protein
MSSVFTSQEGQLLAQHPAQRIGPIFRNHSARQLQYAALEHK